MYFMRWETEPIVYKPITAITQAAPCVITSVAHGVPQGWNVAVVSVKGMKQINAQNVPPKAKDYHVATVLTVDAISLNAVNAFDYSAYTSGGLLQYNTPHDLTGYTAALKIYNKSGGTLLRTLANGTGEIVIDSAEKSIKISLTSLQTTAITWSTGVYELEMTSPLSEVFVIASGTITVVN